MSTPHKPGDDPDVRLAELLADAVSDVEPGNRLDEIRNRTKVVPMSARRPWLFAVGGAAVATAAVVTAVALIGAGPFEQAADPGPANPNTEGPKEPKPTKGEDTNPAEPTEPTETSETEEPPASGSPVPVYLVSETPQGLRLFREFQPSEGEDPLLAAAMRTVEGDNLDPDYRSLWPAGSSVASVESDGADVLTVDVTGAPHDLPSGMTDEDAQLAIQQVVYSVQAAFQQGRVGVQLLLDGQRTDMVLGQPTSEPLANAPISSTLSQMQITFPNEGDTVPGTFTAEGVNNAFEATFDWRVLAGEEVVAEGFGTADGCCEVDKLFRWSAEIDVSDLEPGAYTLVASNSDPSGGAEGAGPHVDTRTFFVE